MNPLLTLRPLATDIEELVGELADLERGLGDTGGLDTGAEDVLVGGHVVGRGHAVDGVEVVDGRVVELELAGARDGLLDSGVFPEAADGVRNVAGEDVALDLARQRQDDGTPRVVLRGELDVQMGHSLEDGAGKGGE